MSDYSKLTSKLTHFSMTSDNRIKKMGLLLKARWAVTDFVYSHLPRARLLQQNLDDARKSLAMLEPKVREIPAPNPAYTGFSSAYPSHQAAIDLFQWTTAMPEASGLLAGENDHFSDSRVPMAAPHFGGFAGKTILELGPYEGYNTSQFERAGAASVVSIESSRENFLKCLVVKNAFGLHSTFLHGDVLKFLHHSDSRFDICWASGILYHMTDPLSLLEGIARISKTAFIWTQYHDDSRADEESIAKHLDPSRNQKVVFQGKEIILHHRNYNHAGGSYFSGGDASYSYWMSKEDIVFCLDAIGFKRIVMLVDNVAHPPGAAMFFLAFAD